MYIDAHTHLNFPDFEKDFSEVLARMEREDVFAINVGTHEESSRKACELAEQHPERMRAIIGLHPIYASPSYASEGGRVETFRPEFYHALVEAYGEKIVGVGECGLDYFHTEGAEARKQQEEAFRAQIIFAQEHDLPLMLHLRPSQGSYDAYEDALTILRDYPGVRGDVHFFAGTEELAQAFLDLGFYISFTGVITFARSFEKLIKAIPLNRILSETDAPYVAPHPYRGQRNEPSFVVEVTKKIARVKNLPLEDVKARIYENAKELFRI